MTTSYHYSVWPQYLSSPAGEYHTYGLAAEWVSDGRRHRAIVWGISPDAAAVQRLADDANARNMPHK